MDSDGRMRPAGLGDRVEGERAHEDLTWAVTEPRTSATFRMRPVRRGSARWHGDVALGLGLGAVREAALTSVTIEVAVPPGAELPQRPVMLTDAGAWGDLVEGDGHTLLRWRGHLNPGHALKARLLFRRVRPGEYGTRIRVTDAAGREREIGPYVARVAPRSRWSRPG